MFWLIPALGASLTNSFHNIFIKKQTGSLDPFYVSWIRSLWITILLLPLIFIFPAETTKLFWIVLVLRGVLDSVATVLYVRAISYTDLSLALPLITLTPLFIFILEKVFLHTQFSLVGTCGVILVVVGIYLLNLKKGASFFSPIKHVYDNPGSRLMFCVSVLWSITSTIHGVAIRETNPYFYAGISSLSIILILTLYMFISGRGKGLGFYTTHAFSTNASAGVFGATAQMLQFVAQGLAPATYVIAIKRMSVVFSSILATIFLKEPFSKRILPTLLSVLGVILIGISLA